MDCFLARVPNNLLYVAVMSLISLGFSLLLSGGNLVLGYDCRRLASDSQGSFVAVLTMEG